MYVLFKVSPLHKNIARAIQKTPKFYFYDTGQVLGDQGVKLENAPDFTDDFHELIVKENN